MHEKYHLVDTARWEKSKWKTIHFQQWYNQCFKPWTGDRFGQGTGLLVEPMGQWSDRMTIDLVYIKIFMTKNYIILKFW